jgi:predicted nucleic acid-binding protein
MGDESLRQAVSDTGPLLHLQEIGQLTLLSFFAGLLISRQIKEELRAYSAWPILG